MKKKGNRLVVGDINWAKTIPDWLLDQVKAERLILGLESLRRPDMEDYEKVGDAELCVYLYTLSLRQPLSPEQANIYIYIVGKLLTMRGIEVYDEMKEIMERGLNSDEEWEMKHLKSMIYDKRGGDINHPLIELMKEIKNRLEQEKDNRQLRLF